MKASLLNLMLLSYPLFSMESNFDQLKTEVTNCRSSDNINLEQFPKDL